MAHYVIYITPRRPDEYSEYYEDALLSNRFRDDLMTFSNRRDASYFAREMNDLDRITKRREWRYRAIPVSQVPEYLMEFVPPELRTEAEAAETKPQGEKAMPDVLSRKKLEAHDRRIANRVVSMIIAEDARVSVDDDTLERMVNRVMGAMELARLVQEKEKACPTPSKT